MRFAGEKGRSGFRAALFVSLPLLMWAQADELARTSARVRELMAAGQFAEAVPLCQQLVRALPSNPGLRLNLGLALQMSGRAREAIPEFERVLKSQPNSLPAALSLGMARLETGDPARAAAPLETAVRLDPDNVNARGMLASALLTLGRAQQAATHYRKLTGLTPDDPKAWHGLGRSYETLAAKAFDDLAKSAPRSAEWLSLVGETRLARRQYRSAFFFFKQALERDPDFRPAYAGIAEVYRASSHPDWAAAEDSKLNRLGPPNCARDPGACAFALGRFAEAARSTSAYWRTRAFNQLAREAFAKLGGLSESVELHAIRAEIASNNGQHVEAANDWRAALKLSPYDVTIQQSLAAELHDAGDYKGALEVLARLNPRHSPELAFMTGDSLLRSEQPDAAVPHLEFAVNGAPRLVPAQASLGLAYMRTGRAAEAIPHLEAAASADEDGSLHYQLARAYQIAGNAERSKQAMAKYQELRRDDEKERRGLEETAQITAPSPLTPGRP